MEHSPPPSAAVTAASSSSSSSSSRHVHGDKGVYYCGSWVDVEDLGKEWLPRSVRYSDETRVAPPAPCEEVRRLPRPGGGENVPQQMLSGERTLALGAGARVAAAAKNGLAPLVLERDVGSTSSCCRLRCARASRVPRTS